MKCDYCIALMIILLVAAFMIAMYRLMTIFTRIFTPQTRSLIRLFLIPFYVVATITVLVEASLTTAGLNTFYRGLLDGAYQSMHCPLFQIIQWSVYNGSRFYDRLHKAMIASWLSFLTWGLLTTVACLMILINKKS